MVYRLRRAWSVCGSVLLTALICAPVWAEEAVPGELPDHEEVTSGAEVDIPPSAVDGGAPDASPPSAGDTGSRGAGVKPAVRYQPGMFLLRAIEVGREGATPRKTTNGKVIVEAATVHIVHPNLAEEGTTSPEGVRQRYVISAAPTGRGELQLVLQARGATLAAKGDAAVVTLPGGRELLWQELKVTDSDGRALPAHFAVDGAERLRIGVDDRGARYPVRVEPTIVPAEWPPVAERGRLDGAMH